MVFAGQRGYADACKQATGGWPGKPAGATALCRAVTKLMARDSPEGTGSNFTEN